MRPARCFPCRTEVFICFSQCRLHTKKKWSVYVNFLLKLKLIKIQTLTVKTMDLQMFLQRIFNESFSEHDTESEDEGDSGNEEVNNSEWFASKDSVQWRKTKFGQNIRNRCHNIVSRLPRTKGPAKDVTSSLKSWELFIADNMIQLN
ncbi:hypothetical protein AVEN_41052-1 [Araneus ventricosus]|uniref:PiggyBac transposable element-derived protein domain-containing protein n=1 Tax=Araneus ventricosus TaxID=182803 RepID=A0A4Y2CIR5_ARAVE|nr:hypothetical protein AVEN_41052-1 [Araneus ventricosus]